MLDTVYESRDDAVAQLKWKAAQLRKEMFEPEGWVVKQDKENLGATILHLYNPALSRYGTCSLKIREHKVKEKEKEKET